jgi:hypothetical protein
MSGRMSEVLGFAIEARGIGISKLFHNHSFSLRTLREVSALSFDVASSKTTKTTVKNVDTTYSWPWAKLWSRIGANMSWAWVRSWSVTSTWAWMWTSGPQPKSICRYPCGNCRKLLPLYGIRADSTPGSELGPEYDRDTDAAGLRAH